MVMRNSRHNKRSGFNLVEAAIVLGVVGLVIGGIWVAASAVMDKHRVANLSTGVLQITQSLRNLMRNQPLPTTWLWLNETVINASMLPANWTYNDGLSIFAEQGSPMNIGAEFDATEFAESHGHGLVINFNDKLSDSDCINLVSAITSRFTDRSDLVYVAIGSATFLRSFPADMAEITTNCTTRGGNPAVGFAFRP